MPPEGRAFRECGVRADLALRLPPAPGHGFPILILNKYISHKYIIIKNAFNSFLIYLFMLFFEALV